MDSFRERCIKLRKQDYTLPEIVKITGRPKTSVYFHIKNLPLSGQKLVNIQNANRVHLLKVAAFRRGKSSRSFHRFHKWNTDSVFLVSHLLFDGEIKHSGCVYNNRNKVLIEKVRRSMQKLYNFGPKYYQNPITGVWRISYFNVALSAYLKTKSQELLQGITHFPKDLKKVFLQSFFDDEGCMDYRPMRNIRRVRGYQKNVEILKIIKNILAEFEIDSLIQMPNEIVIRGKKDLLKFQKEIGFSSGVRINGNRSNSIWKKHLEKQEILRRAIASYL